MKILVTGGNGQLGRELSEKLNELDFEVFQFSKSQLDITDNNEVVSVLQNILPDIVINTAAYTKVDDCEVNYEMAYKINAIGSRNIARSCEKIGAKLIHFSTDFVFNGFKTAPYFEYDATEPLSIYGQTKLAGEFEVLRNCSKYFIIRTSWLYGKYGSNFVKTMIELSKTKELLKVVQDQTGSPTLVTDLVDAVIKIIHTDQYGIFHYCNRGKCSWHGFAVEIFDQLQIKIPILGIDSEKLNRQANRPKYSVLETRMIEAEFNLDIRTWQEALCDFLKNENNYIIGD